MRLIYDYKSYRTFLKDYYLSQKERSPSFSYAVFAKQVGLSSSAHIQFILSGKRNLTVHNIHRLGAALALPRTEFEYFEALVHQNQAKTLAERRYYDERLGLLHKDKPLSSARLKTSVLLSSAVFPALLLSVEGKDLASASLAASRFGSNAEDSERILRQLFKEGILVLEQERIRLSQRHLILHDKKARSQAQKSFLAQQLRLSVKAFERTYDQEGKFFAHTFTLDPAQLELFSVEIKSLLERITKLSDEVPGESVMQLNVQLFPYENVLN